MRCDKVFRVALLEAEDTFFRMVEGDCREDDGIIMEYYGDMVNKLVKEMKICDNEEGFVDSAQGIAEKYAERVNYYLD